MILFGMFQEVHRADVVFDPVENIVAPIEKAAEEENAKNEEQPTILTVIKQFGIYI